MATFQPSILHATAAGPEGEGQRVFLIPIGSPGSSVNGGTGFFKASDREYKAVRDGSHDTGVRVMQRDLT